MRGASWRGLLRAAARAKVRFYVGYFKAARGAHAASRIIGIARLDFDSKPVAAACDANVGHARVLRVFCVASLHAPGFTLILAIRTNLRDGPRQSRIGDPRRLQLDRGDARLP